AVDRDENRTGHGETVPAATGPVEYGASTSAPSLGVLRGRRDSLLGTLPLLASDDVARVPSRPVMRGRGRLVVTVMLLCLAQQGRQVLDLHVLLLISRCVAGHLIRAALGRSGRSARRSARRRGRAPAASARARGALPARTARRPRGIGTRGTRGRD